MADQLSLPLETDRLPGSAGPAADAAAAAARAVRLRRAPVRAVVGRGAGPGLRSGRPTAAGAGDVRIVDADGVDLTAALPELAGMAVRVAARSAILDGELVVVDAARPGRRRRARRAAGRRAAGGRPRSSPSTCSTSTVDRSSSSRSSSGARRSAGCCGRATRSSPCPAIATEGRALFDAVVAQGIAGIMARQRQEPVPAGDPQPAVAVRRRPSPGACPPPSWRRAGEPAPTVGHGAGARADQPAAARRRGLTGADARRSPDEPCRPAAPRR